MRTLLFGLLLSAISAAPAETPSAADIVRDAHLAAGGEVWRRPSTLYLEGKAELYADGTLASRQVADRYTMWREFPAWNDTAHAANGKVRIDAAAGDKTLFQIAFDGEKTYNQDGEVPGATASREWSENFGFGIIRFALDEGFKQTLMAPDSVDGQAVFVVKIIDPTGSETTFAIDQKSHQIRRVGFNTPRGWHERIYSDFFWVEDPGWMQPGRVRLYYNGVKTNDIRWTKAVINQPIVASRFVIAKDPESESE